MGRVARALPCTIACGLLALPFGMPSAVAAPASDGTLSVIYRMVPLTRQDHAGVYDPEGDRLVIFGGTELLTPFGAPQGALNDLFAIPLDGTPGWWPMEVEGARPAARTSHTMILDRQRRRAVVFGGGDASNVLGDLFSVELSGAPQWTQLAPSGPAPVPRWGHTAIYDPGADRMVVFGGFDAGGDPLGDVWALALGSGGQWTRLTPSGPGPAPRGIHAAVFDSRQRRMLIMGGSDGVGGLNDVWALPLDVAGPWEEVVPSGTAPPPAGEHSAVFDSLRNMVVLVGRFASGQSSVPPVYRLTFSTGPAWNPLASTGDLPVTFERQVLVRDPKGDRIVLFGGREPVLWTQPAMGGPWNRSPELDVNVFPGPGHPDEIPHAIFDAPRNRLLHFFTAERVDTLRLWELSLDEPRIWRRLTPGGLIPPQRAMPSYVIDTRRSRLLFYGGLLSSDPAIASQIWIYDLVGNQWSLTGGPGPAGRFGHSAVYDSVGDRMIAFGGRMLPDAGGTLLEDAWSYDAQNGTWSALAATGAVPARERHAAVIDPDRNRMLIHGGSGHAGSPLDDVWELALGGAPAWAPIQTSGLAPGLIDHSAFLDVRRERMVLLPLVASGQSAFTLSLGPLSAWRKLSFDGAGVGGGHAFDVPGDRVLFSGESTHALSFHGAPLPALSLIAQEVAPHRVNFLFDVDAPGMTVVLWRRPAADGADWMEIASRPASENPVAIEDVGVEPGHAYFYRASLRDDGGEQFFDEIRIEVPLQALDPTVQIWPNPATTRLTVRLQMRVMGDFRIELLDLQGRSVVLEAGSTPSSGVIERTLDLPESSPPGLYHLRVRVGDKTEFSRLTLLR